MKIIKRNGEEAEFNRHKIEIAVGKANVEVPSQEQLTDMDIQEIAVTIEDICKTYDHALNLEDIQDLVETQIMDKGGFQVAQKYIKYRYKKMLQRTANTTYEKILSLIRHCNEEVKQENSNKNPTT